MVRAHPPGTRCHRYRRRRQRPACRRPDSHRHPTSAGTPHRRARCEHLGRQAHPADRRRSHPLADHDGRPQGPAPRAGHSSVARRPYSAWRAGGHEAAAVLRRTLADAAATGRYADRFCDTVAAFLPKGTAPHDDMTRGRRRRAATNSRRLALMDAGAKTIMTMINRPLAARMSTWTPTQQQGFIQQRGTLQNVLKPDMTARTLTMLATRTKWDHDDGEPPDAVDDDYPLPQLRRLPPVEPASLDARPTKRRRRNAEPTASTSEPAATAPQTLLSRSRRAPRRLTPPRPRRSL